MLIVECLVPIGLLVFGLIGLGDFLLGLSLFPIPGVLFLASGSLFLLSWWEGRRASAGSSPSEGDSLQD